MENDENATIWKTNQFDKNIEGMRGFSGGAFRPPPRQIINPHRPPPRPPMPLPRKPAPVIARPHAPPPKPSPPKIDVFSQPLPKMNKSSPPDDKKIPYSVPYSQSTAPATSSKTKTISSEKTSVPVSDNKPIIPTKATFSKSSKTTSKGLDTLHIKDPPYVDRSDFIPKIVALDTATTETKLYKREDPVPESEKKTDAVKENPFLEKIIKTTPQEYVTEDNNIQERINNLFFGVDYSNFNATQLRNLIYRIFNFFPELIDIGLYSISYKIVRLFYSKETIFTEKHSKPNKYEADIRSLKLQLYAFLTIPFSYLVGYNLWYLFTTVYPYKKIGDIVDSNSILKYIFETSFYPTVALNYALFGYKQSSGKMYSESIYNTLKPFLCLVAVLFFILVYFYVKNSSANIRNLFNNIIKNPTTTKDPMYSLYFTVVMIAFVGINVFYMKEESPFMSMTLSFMSPVTAIILLLIKMVVVLLTIPIGMLVLIIYLVLFSTIGIAFYNGISNFWGTIKAIDLEIKNSVPKPQGNCMEEGIFTKILRWINLHSYNYLTFFILAIVISSNMSSVFTETHSLKLKTMLIGIYTIIAILYGMFMFWKIYKEYKQK